MKLRDAAVGLEHFHRGRLYRCVRIEPYERKDGGLSLLAIWEARCAACGAPYEIATPVSYQRSKTFERANCDAHKRRAAQ